MKKYGIYSYSLDSPERGRMLEVFPNAAVYENTELGVAYYLFNGTYETTLGETHPNSVDLSSWVLVDTVEEKLDERYLTYAEFDAWAAETMQQEHIGIELILNRQCAIRLYKTVFSVDPEEA